MSLTKFTWKDISFCGRRSTRGTFRYLGSFLILLLYCHFLFEGKVFIVYCDASDIGFGCVMQKSFLIDYALRQLKLFEPVTVVFVLMI